MRCDDGMSTVFSEAAVRTEELRATVRMAHASILGDADDRFVASKPKVLKKPRDGSGDAIDLPATGLSVGETAFITTLTA